jgi:ABC-type molybdate transport system substrate-binding protein
MTRPRRLLVMAALCAIAASGPARADYPVAPDVVVFCVPTLRQFITALGAQWTREAGIPVRVFAAPNWANLAQLEHHTRDDVIIGEGEAAATKADAENLIKSETLVKLWRNRLVVAARAADLDGARSASPPLPLDLAAVAGKAPIAIVDPPAAQAGVEAENSLQAQGVWDAVSAQSIGVVGTGDGAFLLSEGRVKLAVLYASDVAANPDFAVTDTLPDAGGQPIIYWAAQTQRALSPNTAKFLDFLRRADVRERGGEAGLEVLQ